MEPRERRRRGAAIRAMFVRSVDRLDADRMRGYVEDTTDLPVEVLEKAIKAAQREKTDSSFAPGIGEIWRAARPFLAQRTLEENSRKLSGLRMWAERMTLDQLRELRDTLDHKVPPSTPGFWAVQSDVERLICDRERNPKPER